MTPTWLPQEQYQDILDFLEQHVFCPDFQEAYAPYLKQPPVWHHRKRVGRKYDVPLYVGTYHFQDGLVVEHQVYDIPLAVQEEQETPRQLHHLCILRLPEHAAAVGHYYAERNRGRWPYNACYATWATQGDARPNDAMSHAWTRWGKRPSKAEQLT